jgi:hypothetical protein
MVVAMLLHPDLGHLTGYRSAISVLWILAATLAVVTPVVYTVREVRWYHQSRRGQPDRSPDNPVNNTLFDTQ